MQLIADSGSTKVDWRAIKEDGSVIEISTEGINPVFQTREQILDIFNTKLVPVLGNGVKQIFFCRRLFCKFILPLFLQFSRVINLVLLHTCI